MRIRRNSFRRNSGSGEKKSSAVVGKTEAVPHHDSAEQEEHFSDKVDLEDVQTK